MATYLLSFTHSSQGADPDGVYSRINYDALPATITDANGLNPLGFSVSGTISTEIDNPVVASGTDQLISEWADSARWTTTDKITITLTDVPSNCFCSYKVRTWDSDSPAHDYVRVGGDEYVQYSGTSTTNRSEVDSAHFRTSVDGTLTVEVEVNGDALAALTYLELSFSEPMPDGAEVIQTIFTASTGHYDSLADDYKKNSFGFLGYNETTPDAINTDIVSRDGDSTLRDVKGNLTPYRTQMKVAPWNDGGTGNPAYHFDGFHRGAMMNHLSSKYADGIDPIYVIKDLPVGKRFKLWVNGENGNGRDTAFSVQGKTKVHYVRSPAPSSTQVDQDIVTLGAVFDGVIDETGELEIKWQANEANFYYGYFNGYRLALYDDVLLGEADFDSFNVQDYGIGAQGDTFYRDYTPLSSGTANGFNIKIDEFFTCDGFKLVLADASGNHLAISDEVLSSAGDNQTLYVPLQSSVELVAGTTYRLGISLKDSNAGYLRLFGDDNASTWKWYRIDNGGYSTVPTLTGGVESAAGFLPIQVIGEASRVKSQAVQFYPDDHVSSGWSGSNFYDEFPISVAHGTDCLVVRMAGSINPMQSVSLDGVAFTKVFNDSDNNAAGIEAWYLMNPPTGTNTFRVDAGGSGFQRNYLINELSGVDVGFVPVYQSERGWKSTRTTTVNGGDGAYVLSVATWQDTQSLDYDQTSGVTEVDDVVSRSGYLFEAYSQNQVGSGDLTISASQTANQGVIGTVAFAAAGGGTGNTGNTVVGVESLVSETVLDAVNANATDTVNVESLVSSTVLDAVNANATDTVNVESLVSSTVLESVDLVTFDTLGVESLVSSTVLESVDLVTFDTVSVQSLYSETFLDSVNVTENNGQTVVGVQSMVSVSVMDQVAISTFDTLSVESLVSETVLDSVTVFDGLALGVESLVSETVLDPVSIETFDTLSVESLVSETVLESVDIATFDILGVENLVSLTFLDSVLAGTFGFKNIIPTLVFIESLTPRPVVESLTPTIIIEDV